MSTASEVMKHIWFLYSAFKLALSLARGLENHDTYAQCEFVTAYDTEFSHLW